MKICYCISAESLDCIAPHDPLEGVDAMFDFDPMTSSAVTRSNRSHHAAATVIGDYDNDSNSRGPMLLINDDDSSMITFDDCDVVETSTGWCLLPFKVTIFSGVVFFRILRFLNIGLFFCN